MARECTIDQCSKVSIARGLCHAHYKRWQKYGDPLHWVRDPAKTKCSVYGCDNGGRIKLGYCEKHYQRFKSHGSVNTTLIAPRGAPQEFVSDLLAKGPHSEECVIWPHGRAAGYAVIRQNGRSGFVHRIICEALNGRAKLGQECRHICGNGIRGCVNPSHLEWGTHAENMADMKAHGAHNPLRGEAQWMARLTRDDVRNIRAAAQSGETQQSIAGRYGVNQTHVSAIVRRKKWAWLE